MTEAANRDQELQAALEDILRRHDPIGLILMGAPDDEYLFEAGLLAQALPRCEHVPDVTQAAFNLFTAMFKPCNVGTYDDYRALATEAWALWQTHQGRKP